MTLIKFNRGLETDLPVLNSGEPAWTTDSKKLFIGDGTTNHEITSPDIDVFDSAHDGLCPASGGGSTNYLRSDGTWHAPPDTTGVTSVSASLPLASSGGSNPDISLSGDRLGVSYLEDIPPLTLLGNPTSMSYLAPGTIQIADGLVVEESSLKVIGFGTTKMDLEHGGTGSDLSESGPGVIVQDGIGENLIPYNKLPIVYGGTNSSASLANNKLMWSASDKIVEASALNFNGAVITFSPSSSGATASGSSFFTMEASTGQYLNLLFPNTTTGGFFIGDPQSSSACRIDYQHTTDNLRIWSGTGTCKLELDGVNNAVGVGATASNVAFNVSKTFTANTSSFGIRLVGNSSTTSTTTTNVLGYETDIGSMSISTGVTDSGYRVGFRAQSFANTSGFRGTLGLQYGVWARTGINSATTGATISTSYSLFGEILNNVSGTTISNGYGCYLTCTGTSGSITNLYGLYIDNLTAGSVNYAIYTAGGAVRHLAGSSSVIPLTVKGALSQTGNLFEVQDNSGIVTRINKDGYHIVKKTAAPADADLNASEMALWLDATPGTTLLKVKAKDSSGTVRTGSVSLV